MISKELLSEVLDVDCHTVSGGIDIDGATTEVAYSTPNNDGFSWTTHKINIYQLAHKCKEWAFRENNIEIASSIGDSKPDYSKFYWYAVIERAYFKIETVSLDDIGFRTRDERVYEDKYFEADTEPESIFKATQYIIDNKEN